MAMNITDPVSRRNTGSFTRWRFIYFSMVSRRCWPFSAKKFVLCFASILLTEDPSSVGLTGSNVNLPLLSTILGDVSAEAKSSDEPISSILNPSILF